MLVLTRKEGESIIIDVGEGIEINVIETGSNSVRLGVKAPRSVDIWRKEIIDQVRCSNRKAAMEQGGKTNRVETILRIHPEERIDS